MITGWEQAAWGIMLIRGRWQARSLPDGEWIVWRGGSIVRRGTSDSMDAGAARCEEMIETLTADQSRGAGSKLEALRAKWRRQKREQADRAHALEIWSQ